MPLRKPETQTLAQEKNGWHTGEESTLAEETQNSMDLLKKLGEGAGEYQFQLLLVKSLTGVLG